MRILCVLPIAKWQFKICKQSIFLSFIFIIIFMFYLLLLLFSAIIERSSYDVGVLKIRGVATCLYLCMNSCGHLYGSVSDLYFYDAVV